MAGRKKTAKRKSRKKATRKATTKAKPPGRKPIGKKAHNVPSDEQRKGIEKTRTARRKAQAEKRQAKQDRLIEKRGRSGDRRITSALSLVAQSIDRLPKEGGKKFAKLLKELGEVATVIRGHLED